MFNTNNEPGIYELPGAKLTSLQMRKKEQPPVLGRILWPALGFPAVISPRKTPAESQMLDADATRCICLLVLSNKEYLSKAEAARYLRYVPWDQRNRRYIAAGEEGSFAEVDIEVKNDIPFPKTHKPEHAKLTMPGWKDSLGTESASGSVILFGGDREGNNSVTVKLSEYVRGFYKTAGLHYIHEIRISERVSATLRQGLYQLFWNDETINRKNVSPEMDLLMKRFAWPFIKALGSYWKNWKQFFLQEYEFEFGSLHKPYKASNTPAVRTELLHPLFVKHTSSETLKIGHLTDLHIDTRTDVYEENLKQQSSKYGDLNFNNWNKNFTEGYSAAKKENDILLLTGDLVDYGRGHLGTAGANKLGDNQFYHENRNWFLFYYLLASGNAYEKPAYTTLGNHDWRVNPYPPFAPGAPGFNSFFHNHQKVADPAVRRDVLKAAHGPGYEHKFSYGLSAESKPGLFFDAIKSISPNKDFWNQLPVYTTINSVKWYLLLINPFLDYSFSLPGGHKVLMLDWAEKEKLFFDETVRGQEYPTLDIDILTMPGPKAKNALTAVQKLMIEGFLYDSGKSKIIGMHMPPLGPYPDWYDEDILKGWKVYKNPYKSRGNPNYAVKNPNGAVQLKNGHPLFALLPENDGKHNGMIADYGSFEKDREWFIRKVTNSGSGVKLIFSGHIHRNGLYYAYTYLPSENAGVGLTGKTVIKSIYAPLSQVQGIGLTNFKKHFPLFVNTTSLGLRGGFYSRELTGTEIKMGGLTIDPGYSQASIVNNGIVSRVEFKAIKIPSVIPVQKKQISKTPFEETAVLKREFML